jgi:hypothetical protein
VDALPEPFFAAASAAGTAASAAALVRRGRLVAGGVGVSLPSVRAAFLAGIVDTSRFERDRGVAHPDPRVLARSLARSAILRPAATEVVGPRGAT